MHSAALGGKQNYKTITPPQKFECYVQTLAAFKLWQQLFEQAVPSNASNSTLPPDGKDPTLPETQTSIIIRLLTPPQLDIREWRRRTRPPLWGSSVIFLKKVGDPCMVEVEEKGKK